MLQMIQFLGQTTRRTTTSRW